MKSIEINRSIMLLLYNKYRDYIVPIATIVVSFLLFMLFTIPQISSLSTRQQEVKFERDKLTSLRNNLNILSSLNDSVLNSQLTVASEALPSTKNFSGVLNTISISANKTGIFLGDFDFQVGDLSSTNVPAKGFPNLQLSLTVNGNVSSVARFINELYRSLPIVEVTKIDLGGNHAQLNTLFYYKPYAERNIDAGIKLSSLTKNDLDTIREISSWNNPGTFQELQPLLNPSSSSSTSASFSAF